MGRGGAKEEKKGVWGRGVVVMWLQADERGPKEEEKTDA